MRLHGEIIHDVAVRLAQRGEQRLVQPPTGRRLRRQALQLMMVADEHERLATQSGGMMFGSVICPDSSTRTTS